MQRGGAIRAFVAQPYGKAVLAGVSTVALAASFVYLGAIVAIPTFLVFGLVIPILFGIKRGRTLALMGLAALIVAAPIAGALLTNELRTPSGPASSLSYLPYGNGGSVLEDANVAPFLGPGGASYTFHVTVNPQYLPPNSSTPLRLTLFVATCPDPTSSSSVDCSGSGGPFLNQSYVFPTNWTGPAETRWFNQTLPGANLWYWQFGLELFNTTNASHPTFYIFLASSSGGPGIQGPVTGSFLSTFDLVLSAIFFDLFFYSGLVFFFALLVYVFFKSRERRRKEEAQRLRDAAAGGAALPGSPEGPAPPAGSAGGGSSTTRAATERVCPNCDAVVYASESRCWKCGSALPSEPAQPLTSSP